MMNPTPNSHLPFGDQRTAPWYGKDVLSVRQFNREDLEYIFAVAHEMRVMVERIGTFDLLKGKILANLFYEPSTRTSSSFTAAMERLGGSVIPINQVTFSSVSKGESLPDTVRTLECYADVTVLRHPEVGSAALAAKYARKPVINAGDGVGEHPTQALLDALTIKEELGHIDGLTVTMLGDLKHGRTIHSLARLLSLYKVKLNYVSPDILRMPPALIDELAAAGVEQAEYGDLTEAYYRFSARQAAGGAGLIITGNIFVSPDGRTSQQAPLLERDDLGKGGLHREPPDIPGVDSAHHRIEHDPGELPPQPALAELAHGLLDTVSARGTKELARDRKLPSGR
jgi:aspartate carbamoyltransferase